MAECKDCIHFCVCSPYTAPNESYPEVDGCKCFRAAADVVQKSEVERLEGELIVESTRRKNAVNAYHDAKTEVAREIFAEIENEINNEIKNNYKVLPQVEISNVLRNRISGRINAFQSISDFIAELKKKYI